MRKEELMSLGPSLGPSLNFQWAAKLDELLASLLEDKHVSVGRITREELEAVLKQVKQSPIVEQAAIKEYPDGKLELHIQKGSWSSSYTFVKGPKGL